MKSIQILIAAVLTLVGLTIIANAQMPDPDIEIVADRTALLITHRQNGFLSPEGVTWRVVSESTAAAMVEVGHGDESALASFRFIVNTVWTPEGALQKIRSVNRNVGSNTLATN